MSFWWSGLSPCFGSILWRVLRQEDPSAEGSRGCFSPLEQMAVAIWKVVSSQSVCMRTLCLSLLVGLSIWRGEAPILEENRPEKLVICIFLLKNNRTTSQVLTLQKFMVWWWLWSELAAALQSSTQLYQLSPGSFTFRVCTPCTVPCPSAGQAGLTSPCCSRAQTNQAALVAPTILLRSSWHLEISV